jgi:hypothetical protein
VSILLQEKVMNSSTIVRTDIDGFGAPGARLGGPCDAFLEVLVDAEPVGDQNLLAQGSLRREERGSS